MEQKLYPSLTPTASPPAPYDVESMIIKRLYSALQSELQKVNSFNTFYSKH